VGLSVCEYADSSGVLREVYDAMREQPLPQVYRPAHDGVPGIIAAHSLDPQLLRRVFAASKTLNGAGPLTWPERELVNTITRGSINVSIERPVTQSFCV
jgi:hypothetical protein